MKRLRCLCPSILLFLCVILLVPLRTESDPAAPDYWPTAGWRSTTPEEQGVDSALLVELLEAVKRWEYDLRSIIVVRNGYVVMEAYFQPFQGDTWHIIHSCTKSITSALVGIAIDRGYVEGVHESVLGLFPEKSITNLDENKKSMKLEHLLTMSSGLQVQDSYLYNWRGMRLMTASNDWVQFVLDLPMAEEPGTRFEYSNGVSFLLSAILHKKTGMNALDFARKHLFDPLGIGDVDWRKGSQGVCLGWGEIRMKPLDIAKIGYLYLNKGRWDGEQIVSTSWVESSTTEQIRAGTLSDGYGYQWWIDDDGYYMMLGYGGQYVVVVPDKNLVIVIYSALKPKDFFLPKSLVEGYIIPSAESSVPIEPNPNGNRRLAELINAAAAQKPSEVSPLPETALLVSGKTYEFDPNFINFRSISLTFDPMESEAQLSLAFGPKHITTSIGLDDVYRLSQSEGYLRAYKGLWENDSTFAIIYQVVDYTERGRSRITFKGETMTTVIEEGVEGIEHTLTGRIKE